MKQIFLFYSFLFTQLLIAQWTTVGSPGFINNSTYKNKIYTDNTNIPYMVFKDGDNAKARVMKFSGTNWDSVGIAGFSPAFVNSLSMAFNTLNQPYVAFSSQPLHKASVMKYNGSNWILVGNSNFSLDACSFTTIALDSNDTPYVAFRDIAYGARASVMKFDGANWVYVGAPGFSAGNGSYNGALDVSFKISHKGELYISYLDQPNSYKASVMKFDGSNWVYVGNPGFSPASANHTSLAFDTIGTPYIAYVDGFNSYKATVMKFDGTNWVNVGNAGFTPGGTENTSLAIDKNNTPYISFKDYSSNKKASLMKFDGTHWVNVGQAGFSMGEVYDASLAIDNNGTPYVGYSDHSTTPQAGYPTVMKFNNVTGIKQLKETNETSLRIHPNPTTGLLNISSNEYATGKTEIKISNVMGQCIFSKSCKTSGSEFNEEVDLSAYPKGIYFIEINAGDERMVKKVILQ